MGVAGVVIEDQTNPKRCGHMAGKSVVSLDLATRKLEAALAARKNPDFMIVGRTDARAVNGLDDAIAGGKRFVEIGVDAICVEAPQSEEELKRIGGEIETIQFANMAEAGRTPISPPEVLGTMGYSIIVYPGTLLLRVVKTIEDALADLGKGPCACPRGDGLPRADRIPRPGEMARHRRALRAMTKRALVVGGRRAHRAAGGQRPPGPRLCRQRAEHRPPPGRVRRRGGTDHRRPPLRRTAGDGPARAQLRRGGGAVRPAAPGRRRACEGGSSICWPSAACSIRVGSIRRHRPPYRRDRRKARLDGETARRGAPRGRRHTPRSGRQVRPAGGETDAHLRHGHLRGDYQVTLLRYPRVYRPPPAGAAEWASSAYPRRPPPHPRAGGGYLIQSVLYVENAARIVLAAIDNREASAGQVFNCADPEPLTHRKWIRLIAEVMGADVAAGVGAMEQAQPFGPTPASP